MQPANLKKVILALALLASQDWPTFLGPHHDGTSRETGLLASWPKDGPPLLWKKKFGHTYATPSIAGEALIVFHRVGDEEVVERLDAADGKSLWRHAAPVVYEDRFRYSSGPRAAPTLDGDRVYTLGVAGRLTCLQLADGKEVWSRTLLEDYFQGPSQNFFGVGGAPRIDGEAILLNLGNEKSGCVTAIDKKTGKTLWKSGEDGASYSTPVCADVAGSRLAFFLTREGGLCASKADGAVRWTYPFRDRENFSANAASPLVIGDKLFLTASYGVGSALLKLEEKGFKEIWRNDALGAHWATPIHVDGHLYGFDGRHEHEAQLRCVRLADGKVLWSREGYYRGSMIRADGKFIILSEDGRLVLAELTPEGAKEISSAKVLGPHCWGAPVLSRGRLWVMNFDHRTEEAALLCLDLRVK